MGPQDGQVRARGQEPEQARLPGPGRGRRRDLRGGRLRQYLLQVSQDGGEILAGDQQVVAAAKHEHSEVGAVLQHVLSYLFSSSILEMTNLQFIITTAGGARAR